MKVMMNIQQTGLGSTVNSQSSNDTFQTQIFLGSFTVMGV